MCVCVCAWKAGSREGHAFFSVMYLMIMEAYGVCALMKLLGMLIGFQLV